MSVSYFNDQWSDNMIVVQKPYWNTLTMHIFKNSTLPSSPSLLSSWTEPSNSLYAPQPLVVTGSPAGPTGMRSIHAQLTSFAGNPSEPQELVNGYLLFDISTSTVVSAVFSDVPDEPYLLLGTPFTVDTFMRITPGGNLT